MTYMPQIDRRSFLVSVAAAGAGLALGFGYLTPSEPAEARRPKSMPGS